MSRARHFTPAELADRLCCSPATLAEWRCKGVGPRFIKFGLSKQARVRYAESEIEAWEAKNGHSNTGGVAA